MKKYNEIGKELIKVIIFVFIFLLIFYVFNYILRKKDTYIKNSDFLSQKQNFHVLFFGSSHMVNDVFPMQLWKDYGIVSYNLGNHGENIPTSYYNILLACQKTNPQLIVIDAYNIPTNIKHSDKIELVHNTLDMYPLSYNKYKAVNDILSDQNKLNRNFEFLFNFSMYHTRWNQLTYRDFKKNSTYEKGAESRIKVSEHDEIGDFKKVKSYSGKETVGMDYFRKIIEYCKESNKDILVIYLPYPAGDVMMSFSKYTQKICDEYNVNYINFLDKDIVDYDTDCYDKDSHLNPSGARKVTDYLGKYIVEHYNVQDQRQNKDYKFWNNDYNKYVDFKINNLKSNEKNLNNYLMLLSNEKDIKYEIKISSKLNLEDGNIIKKLLNNLENKYDIDDDIFKDKQDKTVKITTWDNRNEKEINTVWF